MSLDGAFLHIIKKELENGGFIGARVDKVYQPSREEIIITLRTLSGNKKLMVSANTMAARINITDITPENPKQPPMFCMLMRKHLANGRLLAIRQDGLERILNLDFECMNEIGDMVTNTLVVEIMGRHSNIILVRDGKVIDSIKRITDDISSVRRVLPGVAYELPPREERLRLTECTNEEILTALEQSPSEKLVKLLPKVLEGIAPIFARECANYTARNMDITAGELTPDMRDRLCFFMKKARGAINDGEGKFAIVSELSGKPKDFCFIAIEQYSTAMTVSYVESANELLDRFYMSRDRNERMKQRSHDLLKLLVNASERISKKLAIQRQELHNCSEREVFRVCGDLINANIYRLEKGMNEAVLDNFYTGQAETIKLDVRLTPSQNAQKYYSEYRKLDTAEKMLTKLIAQGEQELVYVDSVFDAVSRTEGESELAEIRQELAEQGYLRGTKKPNGKPVKEQPPMKFHSSEGFEILAGKNNKQNDKLTLKTAKATDIWLHTHDIAGSHVIIRTDGKPVGEQTLTEAAIIAAYNSKARDSAQVPVDYTNVKFVKKPNGAKPGMVIFTNNKTLYVMPQEDVVEGLRG